MNLSLRGRITLHEADRDTLNGLACRYHYLHQKVAARATPFGWQVAFDGHLTQPDGKPSGFIMFATPHFTRLKGEFGYAGLPTQWQVLLLSRLWLHDALPRNSETVVLGKALRLVPTRWVQVHPPPRSDEPYELRKVITFADITAGFTGTLYKAANFRFSGESISEPRHKKNRGGSVTEGHLLHRYIYDIEARPVPMGVQLALFGDDEEMPGLIPFFLAQGGIWIERISRGATTRSGSWMSRAACSPRAA